MTRTRSLLALLFLMLLLSTAPWAHGQKGRSEVEEGNRQFHAGEYENARESYRKALEKVPGSSVATFNLGDSEYKLEEFSSAEESFLEAIESGNRELLAQAHYNLANSLFKQGQIEESIEGYKQALRLKPADRAAKHNLEFALKQQQEQEKQRQQNQDQSSQEDQEDQDQEDQDQQDQEEGESGQQPDEQPAETPENQGEGEDQVKDSGESSRADEEEQQQDQPAQDEQEQPEDQTDGQSDARQAPDPVQGQLTKEEAARLLEAIQEDLQSLRREQLEKLKQSRAEKDW